jgi:hypothetical protein
MIDYLLHARNHFIIEESINFQEKVEEIFRMLLNGKPRSLEVTGI